MALLRILFLIVALGAVAACSGSSSTASPSAPSPTPPVTTTPSPVPPVTPTPPAGPPTITISAAGMSPLDVTIAVGQRVTFVNNDTRPHDVVGGVDPNHPDCPEIAQAGFLTPGKSGDTGIFTSARTCAYHDHTELGVPAFQGRIIIQ